MGKSRKPIVSDPADLMERAAAAKGLDDFGADDFLPGLEICCRALNQDTQMSFFVRMATRMFDTKLLSDRLQIQ